LRYTGKEWEENHFRLSRGGNWVFGWVLYIPTSFPTIGTRNPWNWNFEKDKYENKVPSSAR
jgi:hypothetical protein